MKSSLLGLLSLLLLSACVAVQSNPALQGTAAQPESNPIGTAPVAQNESASGAGQAESAGALEGAVLEAGYTRDMGIGPDEELEAKVSDHEQLVAVAEEIQAAVPAVTERTNSYPNHPAKLSLWSDPAHRERFKQSYLAVTDWTPAILDDEREVLLEVRDLLSEDQTEAALRLLEKNSSEQSTAVFDYFQGNIHLQSGNPNQAMSAFRVAVTRFPSYRQAWNNLGILYVQNARYHEASQAFTKVVELGGATGEMYGLMAYSWSKQGHHLQAETAYRMAVLMDPTNTDWQIGLARSLFEQRQYPASIAMCENLIEKTPSRHELWLMQGEAYARSNQPVEAAKCFEMVDRLGHANAASLNSVGDIYAREGLHSMAARSYMRALAHDPKGSEARALRGAHFLMGQEASEWAEEVVGAMEAYAEEQFSIKTRKEMLRIQAAIAIQSDNAEAEIAVLEKSLELDPTDGRTLIQVGEYKHRQGDLANAIFYFERASKIEGFEGDALTAHGQALVRDGRYKEAVPLLKRSYKIQPTDRLQAYLETVERLARRS